ncbi:MAG TPA: sigma-70 family RNA polymerase sigma factor, partial [Gemmatimonadaceae bacterium]|nr:sigma-70 family RNA polymerase sigma factor [Gemmatimonadaceae bacterium]
MPDARPMQGDTELVAAMARGDERAAATFYDRHSATVMALALRMVRERADAEAIVLESFMQAWRDAARFDASRGSPASWLLTISRTRALDFLRTAGRQAKRSGGSVDDAPLDALATPESQSPALDAERSEQQRAVAAALKGLPDN